MSVKVTQTASGPVVTLPDGTTLSVAGTTTFGIQEALNWLAINGPNALIIEEGTQLVFPNDTTLSVPAGESRIEALGFQFTFNNPGGGDFWLADTIQNTAINFQGSRTIGATNGALFRLQPRTLSQGTFWVEDVECDLGYMRATGGSPSLFCIDVTKAAGSTQVLSSQVTDSTFKAFLEGGGFAFFGFQILSPVSANQEVQENTFDFPQNEGAVWAEIMIGSSGGNPLDVGIGHNKFLGNIAHTGTNATSHTIITNGVGDFYDMRSINIYNGGVQYGIYYGPQGANNMIRRQQAFGWAVAEQQNPGNGNVVAGP